MKAKIFLDKDKVFYYPPLPDTSKKLVNNLYSYNFIESLKNNFEVSNSRKLSSSALLDLFRNIFTSKFYIFNWIENIAEKKYGKFQFILFLFAFFILKIRQVKICWVVHNFHPHNGDSTISILVKKLMLASSKIIITHSSESQDYFSLKTKAHVKFFQHPSNHKLKNEYYTAKKEYDILIWGSIEPYKGVLEFLQHHHKSSNSLSNLRIKIIGRCKDKDLEMQILMFSNKYIEFENRIVPFNELDQLIQKSRFVLFPYLSSSISSSGALIDTMSFEGNIIGPKKGAFLDLSSKGLCFVYNDYDEIYNIIESGILIDSKKIIKFNKQNTWNIFADAFFDLYRSC